MTPTVYGFDETHSPGSSGRRLHLDAVNLGMAQARWSRQGSPDSSRSRLGGRYCSRTGGGGAGAGSGQP